MILCTISHTQEKYILDTLASRKLTCPSPKQLSHLTTITPCKHTKWTNIPPKIGICYSLLPDVSHLCDINGRSKHVIVMRYPQAYSPVQYHFKMNVQLCIHGKGLGWYMFICIQRDKLTIASLLLQLYCHDFKQEAPLPQRNSASTAHIHLGWQADLLMITHSRLVVQCRPYSIRHNRRGCVIFWHSNALIHKMLAEKVFWHKIAFKVSRTPQPRSVINFG